MNRSVNRVNNLRQFFSIPVLVIGCLLTMVWALMLYDQTTAERERQLRQLGEMELYRIQQGIDKYVHISERMGNYVVQQKGDVQGFEDWALPFFAMNRPLRTVQLAPNGMVAKVYPSGNNRYYIGNLMNGPYQHLAECARKKHRPEVTSISPVGVAANGILILQPVYIFTPSGGEQFWGYSIATVDMADFMEGINISSLGTMGIRNEVFWKQREETDAPLVFHNDIEAQSSRYIEVKKEIYGDTWTVRLISSSNWENRGMILFAVWGGLLSTGIMSFMFERNRKLKRISRIDPLTGVYNRKGGDEEASLHLKKDKTPKFMVMALDIDNFKFLNDVYGHDAGDEALKQLVVDIKSHFKEPLILTRNGGDEFIIMKPFTDENEILEKIRHFSVTPHRLDYYGKPIDFYTSLGCASYPDQDTDYKKLCIKADFALYNAKINGKAGWRKYDDSLVNLQERVQLGFKLSDITDNIPGAIAVYRADTDTHILFASDSLIEMVGCSSWEDFITYTHGEYRSMVLPQDRKYLEAERARQQKAGDESPNRQVLFLSYRIRTKSGKLLPVMAAAHYSLNEFHGGIFYVSLFDKENLSIKKA